MTLFGDELKRLRAEFGMSQAAFADAIGYSRAMVSRWEGSDGAPPPAIAVLLDWEQKLKLSPNSMDRLLEAAGYAPRYGGCERKRVAESSFLLANTWEAPNLSNPGTLLDARYQVVPFYEEVRRAELADLEAWCADGAATSVRLFTGAGGSGKTRLFIEWCRRLRKRGWSAGFLPDRIDDAQIETLLSVRAPALAVIDYAESRPALLDLLKRVTGRPAAGAAPLRIALLAREVADWWRSLNELDADVHHLLLQQEPRRLASVSLEGELRGQILGHSAGVFARCLGKPAPPAPPEGSLKDTRFGRPLYLHMAALAAVEGLPVTADSLVGEIVRHEQRLWSRRYRELHPGDALDQAEFVAGCRRLVAAVTLRGGCTTRETAEALQQRIGPTSDRHLAPFLCSLYPGRDAEGDERYLNGLEPDLLGESLVSSVLTDANTPGAYLDRVFDDADNTSLQNGFTVLGRIALAGEPNASKWLEHLLSTDVVGRAIPAFRAATTLGEISAHAPLGQILASALERDGTLELAKELGKLLPEQTVSLREVAVWSTQVLLDALSHDPADEKTNAERARRLNNLGICLGELGHREAGLKTIEQAVTIWRELAHVQPDAFLPELARTLNNLGGRLSELGFWKAALEATEESVTLFRELAHAQDDVFLTELAGALNNLCHRLIVLGRREEALPAATEAVEIRRGLTQMGTEAYLASMAGSLNNLGNCLSELGRFEESLLVVREVVELYRRLAQSRPDAFQPHLAGSLNNLADCLSDLGQQEEALTEGEKVVGLYRELAGERPDAFLPHLAMALNNQGVMLSAVGRREAAREAVEAAAGVYRGLTAKWPDAFLPDQARSLNNLSVMLSGLGRLEAALAASEEAVEAYRGLAGEQPDAFRPGLARSLGVLATCLKNDDQSQRALATFGEAIRSLAPAFMATPEPFTKLMSYLVRKYSAQASQMGEEPDNDLLAPVAAKLRRLGEQ